MKKNKGVENETMQAAENAQAFDPPIDKLIPPFPSYLEHPSQTWQPVLDIFMAIMAVMGVFMSGFAVALSLK